MRKAFRTFDITDEDTNFTAIAKGAVQGAILGTGIVVVASLVTIAISIVADSKK